MTPRTHLPNRRPAELFDFDLDGHLFQASISRFENGNVAEVFLSTGKSETLFESVSRDLAVTASLALQHGCDLETLAHALTRTSDSNPAGPLGKLLEVLDDE